MLFYCMTRCRVFRHLLIQTNFELLDLRRLATGHQSLEHLLAVLEVRLEHCPLLLELSLEHFRPLRRLLFDHADYRGVLHDFVGPALKN